MNTWPRLNGVGEAKAVTMLTPTTVPGRAHGSMIIRSRIPAPLPFQRAITQAVSTPTTIEAAIATADIWEETSSGRRLRGWVKMSTKFCSVYSGGMIWVVQVPFTVTARSSIEATGYTKIAHIITEPTDVPQ